MSCLFMLTNIKTREVDLTHFAYYTNCDASIGEMEVIGEYATKKSIQ